MFIKMSSYRRHLTAKEPQSESLCGCGTAATRNSRNISLWDNSVDIYMKSGSCRIYSSTISQSGGLYTNCINTYIYNSVLNNNSQRAVILAKNLAALKIESTNVTNNNQGGILTALGGQVTAVNSRFYGNTAEKGGAICAQMDYYNYHSSVVTYNCDFENNFANSDNGGAIYGYTVNVVDSIFRRNSAFKAGGVISGSAVSTTRSLFELNSASDAGTIYSSNSIIYITDSNFTSNTVAGNGGATRSDKGVIATGSIFYNNSALSSGGAISETSGVTVTDCTFINNRCTGTDREFM